MCYHKEKSKSVEAADTAELAEENRKMNRTAREVPVIERMMCRSKIRSI